jgi:radical SAM-linked protein
MFKARIIFKKSDEASYISHLDLMRTFQRSFCRAKWPVKYSEGFNPHICMSILSPLSTGFRSEYEVCDVDLTEDDLPLHSIEKLKDVLPVGITVTDVYPAITKASGMKFSVYSVRMEGGCAAEMSSFFAGPVFVDKKSKSGSKTIDMNDYISEISFEESSLGQTLCRCKLSMGEDQLNPSYIVKAMREKGLLPSDGSVTYTRKAILDKNNDFFR